MDTVHGIKQLRERCRAWRGAGLRVGFVPTMGNLHAGHLALVSEAQRHADVVVASVFVNPLQFGPGEDFEDYPRTLKADALALQSVGTDLLFAPTAAEIYPNGAEPLTQVRVRGLTDSLCGAHRPGHFDGVTTVVSLLLNLVQPDVAVFGEKDYQQLAVIRRMVADLHWPVEVVGGKTVRGADGLAMSSRNQYLTESQRRLAPELQAQLQSTAQALASGVRDFERLQAEAVTALQSSGFQPQYFEVRQANLDPPEKQGQAFVILAAVMLGKTRLIDNVSIRIAQ